MTPTLWWEAAGWPNGVDGDDGVMTIPDSPATRTIGSLEHAKQALIIVSPHGIDAGEPNAEVIAAEIVGRGEDRVAVRIGDVVYKIGGRPSANRYDHEVLTAAREAGMPWAPPSNLYEIHNEWGDECPVMAMPYLPDDGSPHDPAAWAAIGRRPAVRSTGSVATS